MGVIEGYSSGNEKKDMFGQTYMINGRNPEAEAELRWHRCNPRAAKIEWMIECIIMFGCLAAMIIVMILLVLRDAFHLICQQ